MTIDEKCKEILKDLTIDEKINFFSGEDFWHTAGSKRHNLNKMLLTDGPHGLRRQEGDADHLGLSLSVPATCFPAGTTFGCSWDKDLVGEMAEAIGIEGASQGVGMVLGPSINIKRNPLCGRNFEYISEDPFLSGVLARAYVENMEKVGVSSCPKHFAVNNQELSRMAVDSVVDERALREIYLRPFEEAVKGGASAIMTSYNKVNGEFAGENKHLLSDILTDEWGFCGITVTDWGASNDRVKGLLCGNHLEMPSSRGESGRKIKEAFENGEISESLINSRVEKIIKLILRTQDAMTNKPFDQVKHHNLARKIAENSAVLLKNQDDILPLQKTDKVAIIGDFAFFPRFQGEGSSIINPTKIENFISVSRELNVVGVSKGFLRNGKKKKSLITESVKIAKKADKVLLFLGLSEKFEAEGVDREDMLLRSNQIETLKAIFAVNPNIIVILSCGSSVDLSFDLMAKGILHMSLGGQSSASATLNLLTGKACPSGKLAETYPLSLSDFGNSDYYPGKEKLSLHKESIFVGYRYFDKLNLPVKYPFGYGLSYTTFEYSDLKVDGKKVTFKIKNTGKCAGKEISQVYVKKVGSKIFRAEKELKGFEKTSLAPGKESQVEITLDERAFSFFNSKTNKWTVENGTYEIMVGKSSRDILLSTLVEIDGEDALGIYDETTLKTYFQGEVKNVSNEEFSLLLGREIKNEHFDPQEKIHENTTIFEGSLKKGFTRNVYRFMKLLIFFTRNNHKKSNFVKAGLTMPYRSLVSITDGMFSSEMLDGVLLMANGKFFKGLAHTLRERKKLKIRKKARENQKNKETKVATIFKKD